MAKTVKTTTRDVLDTYLASFGHGGRMEESQFTTFFGPNFNEKDIAGLVAEYNNCVYTGNYGSFFRALGLANEAYDLWGKDDFDTVLSRGKPTKLTGLIKDKTHDTSASRERGLEGVRTLLRKKYGISKILVNPKFKTTQLIDLDSRNRFDVNIVGITRDNSFFIPKGTDEIKANDIILVIGRNSKIVKFENEINKESKK